MVPLSERRHRLYNHEIPEVIAGLRLHLERLVESKEERERAEIVFRARDRAEAMIPGMSIVQWVDRRNIRGGRNPAMDAPIRTRFLPYLSASMPPGSCSIIVARDCSVDSAPRMLAVPPSSRM